MRGCGEQAAECLEHMGRCADRGGINQLLADLLGHGAGTTQVGDEGFDGRGFCSPSRETSTSPATRTVVMTSSSPSRRSTKMVSVIKASSSASRDSWTWPSRSTSRRAARSVGGTAAPRKRPANQWCGDVGARLHFGLEVAQRMRFAGAAASVQNLVIDRFKRRRDAGVDEGLA